MAIRLEFLWRKEVQEVIDFSSPCIGMVEIQIGHCLGEAMDRLIYKSVMSFVNISSTHHITYTHTWKKVYIRVSRHSASLMTKKSM